MQRVFARWRQIRGKKDGSFPKPHWAKWDSRWIPGLLPYIKEVREGGREGGKVGGKEGTAFCREKTARGEAVGKDGCHGHYISFVHRLAKVQNF